MHKRTTKQNHNVGNSFCVLDSDSDEPTRKESEKKVSKKKSKKINKSENNNNNSIDESKQSDSLPKISNDETKTEQFINSTIDETKQNEQTNNKFKTINDEQPVSKFKSMNEERSHNKFKSINGDHQNNRFKTVNEEQPNSIFKSIDDEQPNNRFKSINDEQPNSRFKSSNEDINRHKTNEQSYNKFKGSSFSNTSSNNVNEQSYNKFKDSSFSNASSNDLNEQNKWNVKERKFTKHRHEYTNTRKQLYSEKEEHNSDYGNDKFLNSQWTVWIHKPGCKDDDWTETSYINLYKIDSIGSFWRFFNNFHLFDKTKFQFFIMRNKIMPIYEDNENKKAGYFSYKFEHIYTKGGVDVGTEVMTSLCLLVMNETFSQSNNEINGISFSIKNKNVYIKLWFKYYNQNLQNKIPILFTKKIESLILNRRTINKRNLPPVNILCFPIK